MHGTIWNSLWLGGRVAVVATLLGGIVATAGASGPTKLHVKGAGLVDDAGQRVVLKGCNLGSWLLIEPWMLGIRDPQMRAQHDFVSILQERFGDEQAGHLMDVFRSNWITPREFELLKSFGFNVVRVPFHHSLLATEADPPTLRPDAFRWLDRAVELAEHAGVYVILDMHGAPGGQSVDAPTGQIDQNHLWDSEANQKRTAWLWQRIAERYRDRPTVVAYDLLNEPWGDFKEDVRPRLLAIVERIYGAIRAVDPDKLIFAPGTLRGIRFYGDPHARGWKNVGFTEHFYPGLFGQGSASLETHAGFLRLAVPAKQRYLQSLDVPYLLGEFNVVHDEAARPEMMRLHYDAYGRNGWLATMWSLRLIQKDGGIGPSNWYLITNAEPFALPDVRTASYSEIEAAFERLGTQPLVADEKLRACLTAAAPPLLPLSTPAKELIAPLPTDSFPGWTVADVSATPAGGTAVRADGRVTIYGGGTDIWAARDEFRFAHQPAADDLSVQAWLTDFVAPHPAAKAGWMLRESLTSDAAHVLIHASPDGRVMVGWRPKAGAAMQEKVLGVTGLPMGLGIERRAGRICVRYTDVDGTWQSHPLTDVQPLATGGLIGLVTMSHNEALPAAATFAGINQPSFPPPHVDLIGANLLKNGSFEVVEDEQSAADRARDWQRWGQWFNRESGWEPRRDGQCVLGYHHWQIEAADSSGTYQDVQGLKAGGRYTFEVCANADRPAAGKHGPTSVELRIESPYGGRQVTVASQTYQAADLATGGQWSRLRVTGTLPTTTARVLIIVNPSDKTPRDAALKFDRAALYVQEPGEATHTASHNGSGIGGENDATVSMGR